MKLKPMSQKEKETQANKTKHEFRHGGVPAMQGNRSKEPLTNLSTAPATISCPQKRGPGNASGGHRKKKQKTANETSGITCRIHACLQVGLGTGPASPRKRTSPPPTAQHYVQFFNILTARLDVSAVLWFPLRAAHTAPQHQKHKICIWPTRSPRNGPQH